MRLGKSQGCASGPRRKPRTDATAARSLSKRSQRLAPNSLSLSQRGSGEQTQVISASGEKLGGRLPRNAKFASVLGTLEFGLGGAVLEVRKAGGVIFIEVRQTEGRKAKGSCCLLEIKDKSSGFGQERVSSHTPR